MSMDLVLLMLAAVADYTAETKENQKVLPLPRTESDNNGSVSYSSHGGLFFANKICPLFPAYSNLYQGKPLSTALLFILPAWPLSAVAATKGRLRMRRCQRMLKAGKVPEATQMDAKMYTLFSLQEKKQQLLVVHRLHGAFRLKSPEKSGESFQKL